MADDRLRIFILPEVDEGALRGELDGLKRSGTSVGSEVGRQFSIGFRKSLSGLSVFTANLAAQLAADAIRSIGRATAEGINNLREFSRGIAEINSILPANAKLTAQAERAIIGLSSQFGTSPQEQARAFYNIVSAGVRTTSRQLETLEVANQAATAGLVDINDAARVLVSSVNAYSRSGLKAEQASDILFTAVKEGQTTFTELANTVGRVAPIASAAGVGFDELSGALAFITKSGVSTDEAVTGLRALLTGVIKPAEQAQKAARKLGIEFSTSAIRSKGFAGFLNDVRVATAGSETRLAKLFPNVRALSAAVQISSGNFNEFSRILGQTADSAGATAGGLQIIQNNLDFKLARRAQEFRNFFLVLARSANEIFGESILSLIPTVKEFAATFISIGTAINNFVIAPLELLFNAGKVIFTFLSSSLNELVAVVGTLGLAYSKFLDLLGISNPGKQFFEDFAESSRRVANEAFSDFRESLDTVFQGTAFSAGEEFLLNFEKNIFSAKQILDDADFGGSLPKILGGTQDTGAAGTEGAGDEIDTFGIKITLAGEKLEKFKNDFKAASIQIRNAAIQGIGKGVGAGFAAFGAALVTGENALEAFGKAFLASIGQAAVALGTRFILEGIAISFNPLLGGPAVGGPLIAAGAALATFGGALTAVAGGSPPVAAAGATGGAGGGGIGTQEVGGPIVDADDELEGRSTSVTVNIQGDVLDSDETGSRIVTLINDAFDKEGVEIRRGAIA